MSRVQGLRVKIFADSGEYLLQARNLRLGLFQMLP